ncbi:MAG: AraC family transcriptional regulator ligand-binding domain-containing protein, partial [Pseudomonadota bacterium]
MSSRLMALTYEFDFAQWLNARLGARLAIGGPATAADPLVADASDRPVATVPDALREALQPTAPSDFFLQAATLPEPADFSVLGYAFASSTSTVNALKLLFTHRLFDHGYGQVALTRDTQEAAEQVRVAITYQSLRALPANAAHALVAETFAAIVGLLRWRERSRSAAPMDLQSMTLVAAEEPGPTAADYERHFGLQPRFGAAENRLGVSLTEQSLQPEYRRSRQAFEAAQPLLGEQGQALALAHGNGEQLADHLMRALVGSFGNVGRADRAAAALNTSE